MPLRKLWNAFRGRNASETSTPTSTSESIAPPAESATERCAKQDPPAKAPIAAAKPARGILSFGRGAHGSLCKAIRKSGATSVLEISVGDGTRAIAVVDALSKVNPTATIRYAAIDEFELGDGDISLIEFHRVLRQHSIRPQIFPQDVPAGIARAACTIGAVDLVLIAQSADAATPLSEDQWNGLLQRVTHQSSVVLRQDGESWKPLTVTATTLTAARRAA